MPSRTLIKSRVSRAVILCVVAAYVHQLTAAQAVNQHSNSGPEDEAGQLVRGLVSAASAEERRALLLSAPSEAVNGSLRVRLTARGVAERAGKQFARAAACFEAA
ncbi:MAG TPA: hypothetical protein VEQ42_04385, partial [Pyrinomonadaceae bacterium]|nr:hypothetical protein [Pyrinomonadaceae bacterium]